jgi:uncharacterized protein (TIGR03118 family)
VSDQAGAATRDALLVDAWGLEFGHHDRIWVNDNVTGVSSVYNGFGQPTMVAGPNGSQVPLVVSIPSVAGGGGKTALPTAMAFTDDVGAFEADSFIFASQDGGISGWSTSMGFTAALRIDASARQAYYTGMTIAHASGGWRLYAADFHNGNIDTYDENYRPLTTIFSDPDLPHDFAPYNIKTIGDKLFVTYAKRADDGFGEESCPGCGAVDAYDFEGHLLRRFATRGALNDPWGIALAPADFGSLSGLLLIGNFGDGRITAFYPASGEQMGQLSDGMHHALSIDGLWALTFGNDNGAGAHNQLFYAAGPQSEQHGVFGRIDLLHS